MCTLLEDKLSRKIPGIPLGNGTGGRTHQGVFQTDHLEELEIWTVLLQKSSETKLQHIIVTGREGIKCQVASLLPPQE